MVIAPLLVVKVNCPHAIGTIASVVKTARLTRTMVLRRFVFTPDSAKWGGETYQQDCGRTEAAFIALHSLSDGTSSPPPMESQCNQTRDDSERHRAWLGNRGDTHLKFR